MTSANNFPFPPILQIVLNLLVSEMLAGLDDARLSELFPRRKDDAGAGRLFFLRNRHGLERVFDDCIFLVRDVAVLDLHELPVGDERECLRVLAPAQGLHAEVGGAARADFRELFLQEGLARFGGLVQFDGVRVRGKRGIGLGAPVGVRGGEIDQVIEGGAASDG